MSEVIVRRTRRDLVENEEYKTDLDAQGILFPKVDAPRRIFYPLPPETEQLYDETMILLSAADDQGLAYNRYRAIQFLKPDKKVNYTNADRISLQLAIIMRVLLVKRLDSSFHAFRRSLGRFRDATRIMADMFAKGTIYIAPNLEVTEYLLDGREDELLAQIEARQPTDPTITICAPSDFEDGFHAGLLADLAILEKLCLSWEAVTEDPKFDTFLRYLKTDLFDRSENRDGKLVIFSESKETTTYLTGRLAASGLAHRILTVDAGNRAALMPAVRANFDANHPLKEQAHDFDIIISTEVLAEGVNLHRSNVIVNYDTPWNSTRLMQRIGRVNRIGTSATHIYVYNFYPTSRVDDDIELRKKALIKLQAFHTALGEDSQIYSPDEEVDTFGLFDKSPEENEKDERLSLLMELRKFRAENPDEFRRVQQLPLRARLGRIDPARTGSSVAFIRDRKRDGFFRIGRTTAPSDDATETAAAAVAEKALDSNPGPNERRALEFLDAFLKLDLLSDAEKDLIRAAKLAVRRVKLTNLQKSINKLQKSVQTVKVTPSVLADKLVALLRTFPLDTEPPVHAAPPSHPSETINTATLPRIILSESFTAVP